MKKIIFVRHGRAEEPSPAFPDFERSLTLRGKKVTEEMALLLNKKEKKPMLFVSSPAFRAYETAIIFARVMEAKTDSILLNSDLYHNDSINTFASIFENAGSNFDTIILFGHNPSFTEIPDRLSKEGCDFLPKSGVVCLSFKTDTWKGIAREKGKIEYFLKPEKTS